MREQSDGGNEREPSRSGARMRLFATRASALRNIRSLFGKIKQDFSHAGLSAAARWLLEYCRDKRFAFALAGEGALVLPEAHNHPFVRLVRVAMHDVPLAPSRVIIKDNKLDEYFHFVNIFDLIFRHKVNKESIRVVGD